MDLQSVKELAQIMQDNGLTSLEVEEEGKRICLKKEQPPVSQLVSAPAVPAVQQAEKPVSAEEPEKDVVNFNDVTEVKSPMVGTIYVAPSPGAEAYVHVGDKVKKGQVLCVIEAMKLMNEFTAPQDGEIVDICIEDGQLVEYGQCLFKMY
ncbi:MAG: acetyl-CoA carboxylase biotin carboxyl carrier protein [Oscillospiraceae bacterium]|jgi:acetyl-CoA carboxylase biotin carboxyl carrier protein|nr:acetyl-CoA carboxylase biotin carboxyl carrier protein [Oscillospiraceae bacterium]MDD3261344.1 acetyl-CoA carboxylase biotin carboxyl carrier protein [Oscillospiraceae bacterium]